MNLIVDCPPRQGRGRVIALHCSGADARQWRQLAELLAGNHDFDATEHYGCGGSGHWDGECAFTLAAEAESALAIIDRSEAPVHLVGHSYGGGVALHVAVARPDRIASMCLYEPSAFHLLKGLGGIGAEALGEITSVARAIGMGVITGDYRAGVAAFVDYWNGPGSWQALRPSVQRTLMRWAPKGPLDFQALLEETTPPDAYAELAFPVLIMRGEHAPLPTSIVASVLDALLAVSRLEVIEGAGHMGPLTHAETVNGLIAGHIDRAETRRRQRSSRLAASRGMWRREAERTP